MEFATVAEAALVSSAERAVESEDDSATFEINSWYNIFSKHSIKTKVVKLPDRFVSYLTEDGIVLPEAVGKSALGNDMLSDEEGDDNSKAADESPTSSPMAFEELDAHLQSTMNEFGGKIMVKINDKAPTDAIWINCGTLMCNSISSVYMLLKASEKVAAALKESDNYLVIRKWANMFPSMEFRCFIHNYDLVAVSQRDVSTHYPFLAADSERIYGVISRFFDTRIKEKLHVKSVVIDVYVDKQDRVWVIGLSPFGETTETDSLLFSWAEITEHISLRDEEGRRGEIVSFDFFRVIEGESKVLPRDPSIGASRGPSDFRLISDNIFSRNCSLLQGNGDSDSSSAEN